MKTGQNKMTKFESRFGFGDKVQIDNGTVAGVVTSVAFYSHDYQVQVSWWNNGALVEAWISEWRLHLVE